VRPFGALIFGRLGDLIGRKYTFLITMTLMGFGTFFIGVLPGYAPWGIVAPIVLIALLLVQGHGARRRIWRRRDLRRRARTGEQARLLHVVDPDHRDARPVHGTAHCSRHPQLYRRRAIWRLGMANPVFAVGDPARRLPVDSPQAQ